MMNPGAYERTQEQELNNKNSSFRLDSILWRYSSQTIPGYF